jgi:uncharacterized protein (DUF433 family)
MVVQRRSAGFPSRETSTCILLRRKMGPIGLLAIIVLEVLTVAKRKQHQVAKRLIGRYVVADPAICHGQPTFRGTRMLVSDVMEQVAGGMAWETIVEEWRGDVSLDAISEAVRLASQAFRDHSAQYTAPEYVLQRSQA